MRRKNKKILNKKFILRTKTKKKIIKKLKKIIAIICIILFIFIVFDINKYENKTITREDVQIDEEKFEFIKDIEKEAKISYENYGVLPSIIIAQAILESGWGKSELTKESNNIFGIKADESWKGNTIEANTSENYRDKVTAKFRKYESIEASIKDHAKFLNENNRYKEYGLFESKTYQQQAKSLENAGYSTKKNDRGEKIYAQMLIEIIEKYKLYLIDK